MTWLFIYGKIWDWYFPFDKFIFKHIYPIQVNTHTHNIQNPYAYTRPKENYSIRNND